MNEEKEHEKRTLPIKKERKGNKRIVLFKNAPITDQKNDAFDFGIKANAIKKAIKEKSNIIGLVGDYGSGKSSLTELLYKNNKFFFAKPIYVNLWDCFSNDEGTKDSGEISSFTKSFLYQLASRNEKKSGFSRYINQRLSKNYGKISFSLPKKISLFLIFMCGLFAYRYFIQKYPEISNVNLGTTWLKSTLSMIINFIFHIINILFNIINFFPKEISIILSVIFGFIVICGNNILFSLWDSQGKIKPSDTDCFEIFKEIIDHIKPFFCWQKRLVIIEDLDRSEDANVVVMVLKEIYRYINLLPPMLKRKFVFIVSLKSESSLVKDKITKKSDGQKFYSKIFDYTVWINPIHIQNIKDIVKELLTYELGKKFSDDQIAEFYWIMQGRQLTIREIKDRLNEVFLLYQSLSSRTEDTLDVKYRKCAAVVYLQREYPDIYEYLIADETIFSEIVQNAIYKNNITIEQDLQLLKIDAIDKVLTENNNIINDLKRMLSSRDIDNDFTMYFYNYPKNSYIMDINEKRVYDHILHDEYKFDKDELEKESINEVITKKNASIIYKALDDLFEYKQPCNLYTYHFEQLFIILLHSKHTDYGICQYSCRVK